MNCVCYNLLNRLQSELGNILSTLVNNRINSDTPRTDDGAYQPNFHLLDDQNTPRSFDTNTFFYIFISLLAIVILSTLMGSRRRRIIGNSSTLN